MEKQKRDLIIKKQLLNKKNIKDSLVKIEESKAFANIKFGIKEKEFEKEVEKFYEETAIKDYFSYRHLGKYIFSGAKGYYYENALYFVEVTGKYIKYDLFDYEAPDQFDSLIQLLADKYGTPQFNYGLKSWVKYDDNQQYPVTGWTIGNKQINVVISGHQTYYTIDLNVFQIDINHQIGEEKKQNDRESQEKALKVF